MEPSWCGTIPLDRCRKSRWRGSAAAIRRARSSEPPSLPGVRLGCCSTSRRACARYGFESQVSSPRLGSERLPSLCLLAVLCFGLLRTVLSRLPGFRTLFTFVNLEGVLHGNIFMDNGAHRPNHSDRGIRLKNIPAHIDTHGATLDGIMG